MCVRVCMCVYLCVFACGDIFLCSILFPNLFQNFFLLSSSMDKTVKLWHISRKECLCCFQHSEFVTSIAFHPRVRVCTYVHGCFYATSIINNLIILILPATVQNSCHFAPGSSRYVAIVFTCTIITCNGVELMAVSLN